MRRAERGPSQAMIDVGGGFGAVERLQVVVDGHALPQLFERRLCEQIPQARLSHEQDLDQLRFLGLEVRDHPQLFERRRIEILRLVHDQESEPSRRPLVNEKLREVTQ